MNELKLGKKMKNIDNKNLVKMENFKNIFQVVKVIAKLKNIETIRDSIIIFNMIKKKLTSKN